MLLPSLLTATGRDTPTGSATSVGVSLDNPAGVSTWDDAGTPEDKRNPFERIVIDPLRDALKEAGTTAVNQARDATATAIAKTGVGLAGKVGSPGNAYERATSLASNWKTWAAVAAVVIIVLYFAMRKR